MTIKKISYIVIFVVESNSGVKLTLEFFKGAKKWDLDR